MVIYITSISYSPGTALTNRALGFIKGFVASDYKVCMCFFTPDEHNNKLAMEIEGVEIRYYWHSKKETGIGRALSLVASYMRFILSLKQGDIVIVLGQADLLHLLVRKKGIRVYHECTEHPDVYLPSNKIFRLNTAKYFKDCAKVEGLFVISQGLKDLFVQHGVNRNIIDIVNIIVDPHRFEAVLCRNNENKEIAYCGTVSNNKDGVDILLRAFARVLKEEPNAVLKIIGPIPKSDEAKKNQSLIESLGIKEKVYFTGYVTADTMPQLLTDATVLALARPKNVQADYGFPTKLGEYLLTGNPVVITKVGDMPKFFSDEENALLAEPNNPQDFANKIIWCFNNPCKAKEIGDKGKHLALKEFNCITETKKIIKRIRI